VKLRLSFPQCGKSAPKIQTATPAVIPASVGSVSV
jgi:hypothetical protein